MCGLFGLLRNTAVACGDDVAAAFVLLGVLAEERGRDSAGVALLSGRRRDPGPAPDTAGRFAKRAAGRVPGRQGARPVLPAVASWAGRGA